MEKDRRLPSVERTVKEIDSADYRIRALGVVVDRDEGNLSAMIDDGTGRIVARFADPYQFALAEDGKRVRVIGKVMAGESPEIEVEIIQDMALLDPGLYEQVWYIADKVR
ncbi:MAG: hypothetical protein AABX40_03370 [Candidatus Hydrothermarchaeota archaeon]